jgi:carbon-monoxide dehydrogenase iron sulfur subunit
MKYLGTIDENCIGCNTCMSICSSLYFKEDAPGKSCIRVSPRENDEFELSVCSQCGTCVDICPANALTINKLGVVMLDKKLCTACYACVAACPTDNFIKHTEGEIPIKCIACGACARECPAAALEIVSHNN